MEDDGDSPNVASDIDSQVNDFVKFIKSYDLNIFIKFACFHRCHCRDHTHCPENLNSIDKAER
jgi:hypothetical protein